MYVFLICFLILRQPSYNSVFCGVRMWGNNKLWKFEAALVADEPNGTARIVGGVVFGGVVFVIWVIYY